MYFPALHRLNVIPLLNFGSRCGAARRYMPSHHPARRVHPSDTVIRYHKSGALLEIQPCKNDRRKGQKGENYST